MVSLGDSFAWGVGIEHDDTYARRVERALGRRPGERWEVVQLARPGMGTVEQAEQLAEEGLAYGPDVVVLGFVLNDSEDENAAEARRARDWEETRRERQERRAGRRLLDRSALWRFVAGRLEATAAEPAPARGLPLAVPARLPRLGRVPAGARARWAACAASATCPSS